MPAHDRRDIMTARAVLLGVAHKLHPTLSCVAKLQVDDSAAVAASIYYAAVLMPATGDAVRGRSARDWLLEVGIR